MDKVTCIIIDDDVHAVDRLENLLGHVERIEVLEKSCAPEKAVELIRIKKPDLVFIDIEMPRMTGFEVVEQLHALLCFPTFIFVTAYNQYAIKAIKEQAFDYLLKPVDLDELKASIHRYRNKRKKIVIPENCSLSDREKEILELIASGKTSKEIGELLYLSKHTVDTHRRNIIQKTGLKQISDLYQ